MSEEIEQAQVINFEQAPKFDPTKKYTWGTEDQFVLNGHQFGVILNALRATVGTQEAQRIILANDAAELIEKSLAAAVESGVVKEAK